MLVASALRQAASLVSPLCRCPTINAGSPGLFQLRFRHFSDLVGFSNDSPAAQPTSQTNPQFTEVFDASFFKKSFNIESLARNYQIEYDPESTGALCALRDATEVPMEDGFSYLKLKDGVPFFSLLPLSNILFIRRWYAAYFATLRKTRKAVLLGNPGIAKSIYQAYYIYRCMQSELPPDDTFKSADTDTNSPAYKKATKPPRVIIRQVGSRAEIYCLEKHVAFQVRSIDDCLLYTFNQETTEYLFEPGKLRDEPFFEVLTMPIKASCSPDKVRYKEFVKNGGVRVYMPCWKENELLMAGKVLREHNGDVEVNGVDYSDEAIQQRFKRFGGIFRHVLPSHLGSLNESVALQTEVLKSKDADTVRMLSAVLPTIEQSDLPIPKVSHMLMQYDVDEQTFRTPPLKIASAFVANEIVSDMNTMTLANLVNELDQMFKSPGLQRAATFEVVVAAALKHNFWSWRIYDNSVNTAATPYDQQNWKEHSFPELQHKTILTRELKPFAELEQNTLYRVIDDLQFPLVDMFYKTTEKIEGSEADVLVGIQVTFAATHAKPESSINKLFKKLALPQGTHCKVLMAVAPEHVHKYASLQPYQFVSEVEAGGSETAASEAEKKASVSEAPEAKNTGTAKAKNTESVKAKKKQAVLAAKNIQFATLHFRGKDQGADLSATSQQG